MGLPAMIIFFFFFSALTTTTSTTSSVVASAHASPIRRHAERHHTRHQLMTQEQEEEEVAVVRLRVPSYVPKGEDAKLECQWRVPKLYSLKWYFNDRELFGWRPGDAPSRRLHQLPGLRVDRARSTGGLLVLAGVGVAAAGRYKCEVIGEAPDFLTADRSASLAVVHIPREPPTIQGTQTQYRVGQKVHLTCLSPPSLPPASLTWFINDRQAAAEHVVGRNHTNIYGDGLLETRAGLHLVLQAHHFDAHGQLRFRCAATIPGLYHKVSQHTIGGATPFLSSGRELQPSPSPPPPSSPLGGFNAPVMESRDSSAAADDHGGSGLGTTPVLPVLLLTLLLSLCVS